MIRSIGAFIQNTVKPLLEEVERLLSKHKNIEVVVHKVILLEVFKTMIYSLTYLILGVLFCLTVYFILR